MWPVGWEALEQWGDDVVRIEPLTGGVGVNEVWSVRVNGHLAVGRLGQRSDADLAWETDLLGHLDREGMPVPVPIPTTDGRHFADGLVVMTYVEGGSPETEADWRRVAGTLRQLHRLTQGWPQRPGWRSSTDLLHAETGTRIDLGAMPPDGVARCRAAWARLTGRTKCVVHGDPNPGNIRMTADRVAMIDWDESHVDVPDLDLALPHNAAGLDDDAYDIAAQARAAWEAAVCWDPSGIDQFAVKRLAEVRAVWAAANRQGAPNAARSRTSNATTPAARRPGGRHSTAQGDGCSGHRDDPDRLVTDRGRALPAGGGARKASPA
jgi:aminoglycoside phosphotransferase (APT) family kinase protein